MYFKYRFLCEKHSTVAVAVENSLTQSGGKEEVEMEAAVTTTTTS